VIKLGSERLRYIQVYRQVVVREDGKEKKSRKG